MITKPVIVVPTNFTRLSTEAVKVALEEVAHRGGTLHFLYVLEDSDLISPTSDPVVTRKILDGHMLGIRAEFAKLAGRLGHTPHRFAIRRGRPAEEILAYAEEVGADRIVMATHGREGTARAFLGSATESVVRHASCPVLTICPRVESEGTVSKRQPDVSAAPADSRF